MWLQLNLLLSSPNPQHISFVILSFSPPRYPLAKLPFVFTTLILNGGLLIFICFVFYLFRAFLMSLSSVLCILLILHLFSFLFLCLWFSSLFSPFLHSLLCCMASGQHQGVFSSLFHICTLSPSISLFSVLSFSCGSLGSHALRLYRCLRERRQPTASN